MTPERWQKVDRLFHQALECAPEEREEFLAAQCGGDYALRSEVESLIESHEAGRSFIEKPAADVAAEMIAVNENALKQGQQIGKYRIVRQLGSGGMGDVYLADDLRLHRKIALKLLPVFRAADSDRVRRFEQEARAASALNHPNIVTIHEIGQVENRHYIVTEFVDAQTLRECMAKMQMTISEMLEVTAQIASALSVAHEAGIIHRDIKPENVMRRRDGVVKVLDFGLAKLTLPPATGVDEEAPTVAQVRTNPGVVMGTVAYMSPEQARGVEVDARSDLWSLGVVLYEMVTGRLPFEGETPTEVIAKILEREPPSIARFARDAPEALEWIVSKALARGREERYQTAREMLADLKKLSRRRELDAERERSLAPPSRGDSAIASLSDLEPGDSESARTTQTQRTVAIPTPSSAEYLITEIKRNKRAVAAVLGVLAVVFTVVGFGIYKLLRPKQTGLSFQTAKFARLTNTGKAAGAAISPDGKWLVHVHDEGGQRSLWLRQVANPNSNKEIVPPAQVLYWGLAFSPDGNYIYYAASEKGFDRGFTNSSLYQMPVLGGATQKLVKEVYSPVSFSPDGKQIAYFGGDFGDGHDKLMIANADGTGARELAVCRGDEYFFQGPHNGVSWSPDGKSIATPLGHHDENYQSVASVSVASGETKFLTTRRWAKVLQVAWLDDGSRLLVTAQEQGTDTYNIWQLSHPAGEAQKVTNDLNSYLYFTLAPAAGLLAAVQSEFASNVWVLSAFEAAQAKPITQGRNFVDRLSWAPNGRIVYSSSASGNYELYSIDARGGDPKQLTNSPSAADRMPAVSADGRFVVFASDRAGRPNVWRMDMDGANAKQLTDKSDCCPMLSPDSRWVIYGVCVNICKLWKVGIDGGVPQQLTELTAGLGSISPDGTQIGCLAQQEKDGPLKPTILSFADGRSIKTFDTPAGLGGPVRWAADGRALIYPITENGISNLWAQPVDGGPPKQLTDFKADRIFSFDLSRDGRQVAVARGTQTSDVVLISDFK